MVHILVKIQLTIGKATLIVLSQGYVTDLKEGKIICFGVKEVKTKDVNNSTKYTVKDHTLIAHNVSLVTNIIQGEKEHKVKIKWIKHNS